MTGKLLKKELALCLHPTTYIMLALSVLTLIPNYPYAVMYFYLTLALFFICTTGRENHDVTYTLTLPVAKRDVVRARFALAVLIELIQLALAAVMIAVHGAIYPLPNAAGMDANLALLASGLLYFGVFHLVFFPAYYRDVNRIGVPFVQASIALFAMVVAGIVLTYAVPLWRALDTPDPQNMGLKLGYLAVCALCYGVLTALALRVSERRFLAQDVR